MTSFRYTHAIVCRLPDSLYHHALANQEPEEALNLEVAREQHSGKKAKLQKLPGFTNNVLVLRIEGKQGRILGMRCA